MTTKTIEQLDPKGNWRAFARLHPAAAAAINAQALATQKHNVHVARTCSHRVANMRLKFEYAAVLRDHIVTGYVGDNMWAQISRQWTPRAS